MTHTSPNLIHGEQLAAQIREDTLATIEMLGRSSVQVRLDAIVVGQPQAALIYARSQQRRCEKLGVQYHRHTLPEDIDDKGLQQFVARLSRDPDVTGILLNLPLPSHLDTPAAQYAIDPYKDVEGVNPSNIGLLFYGTPIIAPCTALAVMAILRSVVEDVRGRHVVIVGQGSIVGKPIALALMGEEATVHTCNEFTSDLARHTRQADILISAAGVPDLIGPDHVQPGAVVIDVGINTVSDPAGAPGATRVVGDVCFDAVAPLAGAITPVPRGVGPVTVAILLQSAAEAARKQLTHRRFQ